MFDPLLGLAAVALLVALVALAVAAVRRLSGSGDAVLITFTVAFLVAPVTVAVWRDDGATTFSGALAAASAVCFGLACTSAYRWVRSGPSDS